MKRKYVLCIIAVICITITSCGHYVSKSDYNIVPNKGLAAIDQDQANIYLLFVEKDRTNSSFAVFRNEDMIGVLTGGTYFYDVVKPGRYQYWIDSGLIEKSRERVDLVVKPGKNYYIRYFPGGFYVVAKLDLISEDVAGAYINGLNFTELKRH